MDENPCMMKLSLQHFFSFDEHEEEGKYCVHHWKHFSNFLLGGGRGGGGGGGGGDPDMVLENKLRNCCR